MIRIKADYNDFGKRYSNFLNNRDEELTIDIRPGQTDVLSVIDLVNTPFATNSICKWKGIYVIAYNPNLIERCGLTQAEQDACILHEIGHLVNRGVPFDFSTTKEIDCDNFAVKAGLNMELLSALCKMQTELDIDAQERIDQLCSNLNLYRPEWTCGRYNAKAKVAIFYNLLCGMCYYYDDISAEVIGTILCAKRNIPFNLKWLSKNSNVAIECILPFVKNLIEVGLLTREIASKEDIKLYRQNIREYHKHQVKCNINALHEMTMVGTADAEKMYMEKVDGITSVMFELTYRCSEKCIHCYNVGATRNDMEKSLRGDRQELDIEDYKKLIDELNEQGLIKVCLSGGDPFSKSIVWEIISYLYEKEIAIDIFTNGINAVEEVSRLANYYPRTIGISLYSGIEEIHDSITRVKGSYNKTLRFIKQCSILSIPMLLKCCIMKYNVKSYYTVKDIAYKYGALPQFDLNITDSVDGDKCASTLLRLEHNELEIVLRDKDLSYYIGTDEIKKSSRSDTDIVCNAGFNTFCITPEGNLQPCCAFPLKIGNVKSASFSSVIKDNARLKWWQSKTIKDYKDCYKHPYCVYCQMCAGNNYIAHGNPLKASDNNCFLAKERYNLALKMQKGDDPLKGKSIEQALNNLHIEQIEPRRIQSINYREK